MVPQSQLIYIKNYINKETLIHNYSFILPLNNKSVICRQPTALQVPEGNKTAHRYETTNKDAGNPGNRCNQLVIGRMPTNGRSTGLALM